MNPLPQQDLLDLMDRELDVPTPRTLPSWPLYHYTDAGGALGILSSKKVWATSSRHLNDYEEIVRGESIVQETAERLVVQSGVSPLHKVILDAFAGQHREQSLSKTLEVYVASFSEAGDLLSQWRAYGANGAGYSIGFNAFLLPSSENADAHVGLDLYRCEYNEDAFRADVVGRFNTVLDAFDRVAKGHCVDESSIRALANGAVVRLLRCAAQAVPRLKHPGFSEEREWRLVAMPFPSRWKEATSFRATPRGIVPYVCLDLCARDCTLDLASFLVGPIQHAREGVRTAEMLLSSHGYQPTLVRSSRTPFRG